VTIGARLDWYSVVRAAVNPGAALVYSPASVTTLKLMYGEAFRAPTVSELELKNTPDLLGTPDVGPEKVRTIELDGMALVGGVHNLPDKEYYTHTNAGLPRGTPNRGREFRIGVEVKRPCSVRYKACASACLGGSATRTGGEPDRIQATGPPFVRRQFPSNQSEKCPVRGIFTVSWR